MIFALLAPDAVLASHQFSDVADTSLFHDEIAWLADAGITKGCNPPTNDLFCPDDNVTRGQLAAFMQRLAGHFGAEDGVVAEADHSTTADSAPTLQGFQAADLATNAWGSPSDWKAIPANGRDSPALITSLDGLGAGSCVVIAKAYQVYLRGDGKADSRCELVVEETVDETYATVYNTSYHLTSFMLLHTFDRDGGTVELRCTHWGGADMAMTTSRSLRSPLAP